jgi:hypothetical protein
MNEITLCSFIFELNNSTVKPSFTIVQVTEISYCRCSLHKMQRQRQGYHVMLNFMTSIFNVPCDNNILLFQLKYPLNGQHVTKVEPVLHSHAAAQATYLPAVVQRCTRPVNAVYMVDKVVLRNVSFGFFGFPLLGLFYHCSIYIYSFIYH